jgi:hypothetical protein
MDAHHPDAPTLEQLEHWLRLAEALPPAQRAATLKSLRHLSVELLRRSRIHADSRALDSYEAAVRADVAAQEAERLTQESEPPPTTSYATLPCDGSEFALQAHALVQEAADTLRGTAPLRADTDPTPRLVDPPVETLAALQRAIDHVVANDPNIAPLLRALNDHIFGEGSHSFRHPSHPYPWTLQIRAVLAPNSPLHAPAAIPVAHSPSTLAAAPSQPLSLRRAFILCAHNPYASLLSLQSIAPLWAYLRYSAGKVFVRTSPSAPTTPLSTPHAASPSSPSLTQPRAPIPKPTSRFTSAVRRVRASIAEAFAQPLP